MRVSHPKKWYIKDIVPPSSKRLVISTPSTDTFNNTLSNVSTDIQNLCSARTSKKKPTLQAQKQSRPPSAEISSRNPNPPVVNPLSTTSKFRAKPLIYNVTSPKIKVKSQEKFSFSQKSFANNNFRKPVEKAKTCTEIVDPKFEQASKSTQCINESTKSLQQLNETALTIKAENPENSTKNVPLVSPINHMMRRLTLSEKEKESKNAQSSGKTLDSGSRSTGIRPGPNKENIFLRDPAESERRKVQIRSYSQNQKGVNQIPEIATSLSPRKTENPLQKITNLVNDMKEAEKLDGNYDLMKNYVKELEDKITDLKSSIELTKTSSKKKINENNRSRPATEQSLNNIVSSARPLIRTETKDNKITVVQVQSLLAGKHQYPKSTTNAEIQKKKFEFQNKPLSIKLQTINPQDEVILEETPLIQDQNKLSFSDPSFPSKATRYYITNAVNSFYGPLNIYQDPCEDNYFTQLCQEHMMQTFQSLHLCKNLIGNVENHCWEEKGVELLKKESDKMKKTLIFDLDETLVHCNESLDLPSDVILPIVFPNGQKIEAGINIRPYTRECLQELSQYYEIIVFTASHSCYANVVLDFLDQNHEFIHHRMYREHCISTKEGVFIKDLRVIKNRELGNMIIVDNAAYSFAFQLENGIPILPFYDFKADRELVLLKDYLIEMAQEQNLSGKNNQTFKFMEYEKYEELQDLIENELREYVH